MPSEMRSANAVPFSSIHSEMAIVRCHHQTATPLHLHEFFEIGLILSGNGVHTVGNQQFPIQRGDVLFISRNQKHGFDKAEQLQLINILVLETALVQAGQVLRDLPSFSFLFALDGNNKTPTARPRTLRLSEKALQRILQQIASLEAEITRSEGIPNAISRVWLYLILGELCRSYQSGRFPIRQPDSPLGKVITWLDRNYSNFIKLKDIAEVAGMSERSLHRLFADTMGISPMAYLNELRIRRASELLSQGSTHLSIADVAQKSGFDDSNYFSRLFKRATGSSPKHFQLSSSKKKTEPIQETDQCSIHSVA